MLTKSIRLQSSVCIHARPATLIATEAKKYESQIILSMDGRIADAKHVLSIMGLAISNGKAFEIVLEGSDEADALQGMMQVLSEL